MGGGSLSYFRIAKRILFISLMFWGQGLRWFVGWLVLVFTLSDKTRRQDWFGQCVLGLFRRLGMTFIKVGQVMSTRPDLVPEHITKALVHLQDNVGPFEFEHVERILEEDLGRPLSELFSEFSPSPIASASVAQVHKAIARDGRVLAVKVRRPDAMDICKIDYFVMMLAAKLVGKLPWFSLASPELAVEQFGRAIFAQLDFRIEARNNHRFRSNFRNVDDVEFPIVFEDLSSERVLCMSHIEGMKILQARRGHCDTKKLARLGLTTLMKMIFEDGFVHADLHPGNLFVLPGNRLAILDLGLVGELDREHRIAFGRFFRAWAGRDTQTIASLLFSLAIEVKGKTSNFQVFQAAIQEYVKRYWGQKMSEVRTGKLLLELLALLRKHKVRMAPSFTIVNIAIAVTEGIGRQLDPDLDLMALAIPYFLDHPLETSEGSAVTG